MYISRVLNILVLILMSCVVFGLKTGQVKAQTLTLELRPKHIDIGTFYNGTKVIAVGKIPADTEAVVRISGHYTELHLKKKGKIAGLLWMNIGDVTLGNVPEVFMVVTSKAMAKKIDDPTLNLGYKYLEKMMSIEPDSENKDFIFGEFVKLQEKSGTYGVYPGSISYLTPQDGYKEFQAVIPVPPKMKQGTYKVEVFAIRDSEIVDSAQEELTLKQVGFPALVTKFAFQYPLVYGMVAVVIAILAGLLMGVLFKGKGGAH